MRVLSLDIETSPNIAYTWGLWQQDVGTHKLIEPSRMICFAAKWMDGKRVHFFSEYHHSHEEMVAAAWHLVDEADVVMHFNGRSFDMKHLNREFLLAGLGPPSPYQEIDLLLTAKRAFKFQSNKLDYLASQLGLPGKGHSNFQLWVDCLAGSKKAWKQMREYNVQDVLMLEDLYERLLPWISNHPNRNLFDGNGCPRCGSSRLVRRGYRHTQVSTFQRYRCADCGGWSSSTKRESGTTLKTA